MTPLKQGQGPSEISKISGTIISICNEYFLKLESIKSNFYTMNRVCMHVHIDVLIIDKSTK